MQFIYFKIRIYATLDSIFIAICAKKLAFLSLKILDSITLKSLLYLYTAIQTP